MAGGATPGPGAGVPDVVEIVTTGPEDDVDRLVRALLDERLVACAQVSRIDAVYRWQGSVETAGESRAALHTRATCADAVTARILELHPYDIPCVLTLPVIGAAADYLDWVAAETTDG